MTQRQGRFMLIVLFAMLVLLRIPALLDGRLWAEDGLFLSDALRLPWWQAITTPHTGYIDLTASTAMLMATQIVDLERVALASVALALLIQVCPAILLVTSRCDWLQPRWVLILALLLVVLPPIAEETWLSPVTSQYHLMVCTALILAFDMGSGPVLVLQVLLLGLASLTGPGPALAAPLFVLRAWIDRSPGRALQAVILSVGALIEIVVFCTHPEPNRQLAISVPLLLSVICVKHILIPFLGHRAIPVVRDLDMLLPALGSLLAIGGLIITAITARGREVLWLYAAALVMMVLSYLGALGAKADLLNIIFGQRYYYAPQVLLGLTLLGVSRTGRSVIDRSLASMLVSWLLLVGIWEYGVVAPAMAEGPSWRNQVAQWRADPNTVIMLWPPTFQIRLPVQGGSASDAVGRLAQ